MIFSFILKRMLDNQPKLIMTIKVSFSVWQ